MLDSQVRSTVIFVFERSVTLLDPKWRGLRNEGALAIAGDNGLYLSITRVVR